jgi:transposase
MGPVDHRGAWEGASATQVAARFGYTEASVLSPARDFRAGERDFFAVARPGPRSAPAKQAARGRIIELRLAGHSVDEIAVVLREEGIPLNRTGIGEVLAEEGLPRLWPRPHAARGLPRRENLTRTRVVDFDAWPARESSRLAGLLLTLPDLVVLDLPALVAAAGYPGTQVIPAVSYLLSLLALKLTTVRRVSHVDDLAADPGAALFAGLTTLPKATALTQIFHDLEQTCS